jgi:diguanylate cyclase (GGDEF)-like protein
MRFRQRLLRPTSDREVPAEVYLSVVDSLYADSRTFFVGALAVALVIFMTAWKAGEPFLYFCAVAFTVVAVVRLIGLRAYSAERPNIRTAEAASTWEFKYVIGTAAQLVLLGTWCVVAFANTKDPFVQLVSVVSTISFLIGVAGRNFASPQLVTVQIVCAAPLIVVALLVPGDIYYGLYAVLQVAFFLSLKFISDRLRKTLLDAVIATRDVTFLANRFDTALNNMPLGLCMFDSAQRISVANRRLSELFGVPPEIMRRGISARDLLSDCAAAGTLSVADSERLASEFEDRLSGRGEGDLAIELQSGRSVEVTFQPMQKGGSVVLFEDITERRRAEAKIHHLARYDTLTGLPNRASFRDQLELALTRTRRNNDSCAVLFLDLDQFKEVNDTLGHPFGDEVLRIAADRLRKIIRETDFVARFAGDEFVVLQSPVRRPEETESLVRRIVEVLSERYEVDGHMVVIGASVGIAMAPQDGSDADSLLKNADMALYRSKSEGRGSWRFFEREMDVKAQARRSLETELRKALANDSFEVYYQPLINLKSKRISTCEALLRWPHPERGMISPAEFIPLAEEMGLIVEIGDWVLRRACSECGKWPNQVRVAVNLSPIQFRRTNMLESIRKALDTSGLPANRLELEITESVLVQDTEATRAALHQLKELGVRISLDDFGTGYSSLSYLRSFPLDKVKIDRSFLQGISMSERSETLLHGVARLSAQLGLSVAVEGVETEEELAVIARERSIDEVQGYLFSPAIPSRAIRKLLYSTHAKIEKVA